jgi:mRNA interferase MazF
VWQAAGVADPDIGGRVERGEVWWAVVDERCAVVVLSGEDAVDIRAIQVVAPASVAEKRGFRLLSAEETSELRAIGTVLPADPGVRAVGVEIEVGGKEGLPNPGAVRIALPHVGYIPCTRLVTLSRHNLVERVGAVSSEKLGHLDDALNLAGLE